jgi:hypothetical protein
MKHILLILIASVALMAGAVGFDEKIAISSANHSELIVMDRTMYKLSEQNVTDMKHKAVKAMCDDSTENTIVVYVFSDGIFSYSSEECR